jgi:hypothetical protein
MLVDIGAIGASHCHPRCLVLRSSRLLGPRHIVVLLSFAFLLATERISARPFPYELNAFQERLDTAAVALDRSWRVKCRSQQYRQKLAEFVSGNILFVLCHEVALKPHLLDWRGQDSQDERQKPDHFASLSDSVRSSTRMRFLGTHTGVAEHCLRGRPVKPRRAEQQSTRFNFVESEPRINILTIRVFCADQQHLIR